MDHLIKIGYQPQGTTETKSGVKSDLLIPRFRYDVQCFNEHGDLKWEDYAENLVTNQGINDLMMKYFKGAAYTAAFYLALVQGASPTFAAGDTAASHAGWTEFTSYSETNRPTLVLPTFSGVTVDNSASRGVFTVTGSNQTISGSAIYTNNTKGGTGGVLYSEALFTQGNKLVSAGDILSVMATLNGATQ